MGFHRKIIPDLKTLKEIHENCQSDEEFLEKVVGSSDALSGPSDSFEYLDEIYKKINLKNGTKAQS